MNKKNYVVLNCPCLKNEYACIENSLVRKFCYECSDCLLKRIIEKCKNINCDCLIDKRKCGAMDSMSMCCELFIKKDILEDLEIEEVNE